MTPPAADSPPPSPRTGLALLALALAAFALNLNTNVLGALLPFALADLALAETHGASLLAAAAVGSALGALLVGPATVRSSRRAVLVTGLSGFAAASALHLVAGDLYSLLSLRALSGVAVGLAYASASALVAELVPYQRRGAALGRFNAGMFLAIPLGMPLAVVFANLGAWRAIFAVQAAIGLGAAVLAVRTVPAIPAAEQRGSTWQVLRNKPAMWVLFATLLHVGSFFTTVQLATTWLDRTGRVAKHDQLWLWIGLGLFSVLGSAVFGRVADGVGKRRFVLGTSVLLAAGFVALAQEPTAWLLLVLGLGIAVVAAARTGPLQALVSGLVPSHELGALMGLRGFAMQIGVAGFAVVAAPVGGAAGFPGVLWLAAGWQALSFVIVGLAVRGMR